MNLSSVFRGSELQLRHSRWRAAPSSRGALAASHFEGIHRRHPSRSEGAAFNALGENQRRLDRLAGREDFALARVFGFAVRCISLRRAAAQPGLFAWRPRAMPSAPAGTFSVITEPAATYAPSPMRTGATNAVSLPMKTRLPIVVGCLATPS